MFKKLKMCTYIVLLIKYRDLKPNYVKVDSNSNDVG
jgi:hypothetical protein